MADDTAFDRYAPESIRDISAYGSYPHLTNQQRVFSMRKGFYTFRSAPGAQIFLICERDPETGARTMLTLHEFHESFPATYCLLADGQIVHKAGRRTYRLPLWVYMLEPFAATIEELEHRLNTAPNRIRPNEAVRLEGVLPKHFWPEWESPIVPAEYGYDTLERYEEGQRFHREFRRAR